MVRKSDLVRSERVKLFEIREVWYIAQRDMFDGRAAYGAETRWAGDDIFRGVYSSREKAEEAMARKESKLQAKLNKMDKFDRMRIASRHNAEPIPSTDDFGFSMFIIPYSVPSDEIEEINGKAYWNRPLKRVGRKGKDGLIKFRTREECLDEEDKKIYLPVLWIYEKEFRKPKRRVLIR